MVHPGSEYVPLPSRPAPSLAPSRPWTARLTTSPPRRPSRVLRAPVRRVALRRAQPVCSAEQSDRRPRRSPRWTGRRTACPTRRCGTPRPLSCGSSPPRETARGPPAAAPARSPAAEATSRQPRTLTASSACAPPTSSRGLRDLFLFPDDHVVQLLSAGARAVEDHRVAVDHLVQLLIVEVAGVRREAVYVGLVVAVNVDDPLGVEQVRPGRVLHGRYVQLHVLAHRLAHVLGAR